MEKEYLSPKEVAELYGVDIRTVYNWIKNKKIQAEKIGGVWRTHRSSVEPKAKREAIA